MQGGGIFPDCDGDKARHVADRGQPLVEGVDGLGHAHRAHAIGGHRGDDRFPALPHRKQVLGGEPILDGFGHILSLRLLRARFVQRVVVRQRLQPVSFTVARSPARTSAM